MVETHESTGYWWRPEDETAKLPGQLTVTKGHAELKLLGDFGHKVISRDEKEIVSMPWKLIEPTRIVGLSASKDEITLEGQSLGSPGDISSYRFPWVLIGKAFAKEEEISFDEVLVEISDLDTWTCVSGFSKPRLDPEHPERGLVGAFDVTFERPPSIEIPLDDGEHAQIEFWPGHSGWSQVTTSITISQAASLRLHFAKRHSLNEVAQRIGQLRNFFCLAVGHPVSVLSVTVYQDDYRRPGSTHLPIKLLWEIPHNPHPPKETRHPIKMVFTLPEAPQGIAEVLKAWFAIQDRFRPVFNLYFGMRYDPGPYSEIRFLAHAQAIETYDRRRRGKKSALDERMHAVLKECPTVSSKLVKAAGIELDEFATSFKDSRDFYTHYNPRAGAEVARGVLLYVVTVQLQAIIEMSLLREIGFSCEAIDDIFTTRVPRYREIANAKAQVADEAAAVPQE
jgi:ApeA N-terminal domain 1/Apea-like HEPN